MTDAGPRCHWVREADGTTTLIPGCWSRVHDPDAECTCGEWSEDNAREAIRGLRHRVYRLYSEVQELRRILRRAKLPEPATQFHLAAVNAREQRRRMHLAIPGGDDA